MIQTTAFLSCPPEKMALYSAILSLSQKDISQGAPISRLLFIDIETTGLSPKTACLSLIGCLCLSDGKGVLTQWVCERLSDEQAVMKALFSEVEDFAPELLITYNGNRFDLPFLSETCAEYGLPFPLSGLPSLDLCHILRKSRALFPFPDLKLSTVTDFVETQQNRPGRCDHTDGAAQVRMYQDYLESGNPALLSLLLTHNKEDLIFLPELIPLLLYPLLPSSLSGAPAVTISDTGIEFLGTCRFLLPFSLSFSVLSGNGTLSLSGRDILVRLPFVTGTFRHFYPDYRNYYYLPEEDCAVLKSLGQFVDKDHRLPATKETCYTRHSGTFMPVCLVAGEKDAPAFSVPLVRPCYTDPVQYCFREDTLFSDPAFFSTLLSHLLSSARLQKI